MSSGVPTVLSGFTYSKVVIVQSLDPSDVKTGTFLSSYIQRLEDASGYQVPVQFVNCEYAGQFLRLLEELTTEAEKGERPVLHVECHGDAADGLVFANGSEIGWEELARVLTVLNRATRFNLVAIFSACFGAHFLGQVHSISPAPCYCLIAPTEEVGEDEVMQGLYAFYRVLITSGDMGPAVSAIGQVKLSKGRWLWEPAELWYELVVTGYVEDHCGIQSAKERMKNVRKESKKQGVHMGAGALMRKLRKENSQALTGRYFDRFFMIDSIPENRDRFASARARISSALKSLRATGRYAL